MAESTGRNLVRVDRTAVGPPVSVEAALDEMASVARAAVSNARMDIVELEVDLDQDANRRHMKLKFRAYKRTS